MIEGIKVSDKWAPISGSPIVNVSREGGGWQRKPWIPKHLGQYAISYVIVTTCCSPKVSMPANPPDAK